MFRTKNGHFHRSERKMAIPPPRSKQRGMLLFRSARKTKWVLPVSFRNEGQWSDRELAISPFRQENGNFAHRPGRDGIGCCSYRLERQMVISRILRKRRCRITISADSSEKWQSCVSARDRRSWSLFPSPRKKNGNFPYRFVTNGLVFIPSILIAKWQLFASVVINADCYHFHPPREQEGDFAYRP